MVFTAGEKPGYFVSKIENLVDEKAWKVSCECFRFFIEGKHQFMIDCGRCQGNLLFFTYFRGRLTKSPAAHLAFVGD